MQNNQLTKSAAHILSISSLYLAAVPLSLAIAQAIPQGAPAATPATAAAEQASKLTYRASGTALTVKELADAQRKKMEDDFYKKAGYTDVAPVNPKSQTGVKTVKTTPMLSLNVLGIYGPAHTQKVDLSLNGVIHTLVANSQLGNLRIESIAPGRVVVAYPKVSATKSKTKAKQGSDTGSTVRSTLKAGDVLEIPA